MQIYAHTGPPVIHRALGRKKASLLFLVNRSEVRARLTLASDSPFRHSLIKSLINPSINQNSAYCLAVLRHGRRKRRKRNDGEQLAVTGSCLLLCSLTAVRPAN